MPEPRIRGLRFTRSFLIPFFVFGVVGCSDPAGTPDAGDGDLDASPADADEDGSDAGAGDADAEVDVSDADHDGDADLCHDDGCGRCVSRGCCFSHHDGGDGTCVPYETCGEGYHDGGDHTCLPEGSCLPGSILRDDGTCEAERATEFGIFYSLWHCVASEGRSETIYDLSDIESGSWPSEPGIFYWWDRPEAGYYCPLDDEDVLRQHAVLLRDAGVDFVYVDSTNHPIVQPVPELDVDLMVKEPFLRLIDVWEDIPGAPRIVPWVPVPDREWRGVGITDDVNDMINWFMDLVINGGAGYEGGPFIEAYHPLWFRYDGDYLILAVDRPDTDGTLPWAPASAERIEAIESGYGSIFTVRRMWAWTMDDPELWGFFHFCEDSDAYLRGEEVGACRQRVAIRDGVVEQIPVTAAYQRPCMNWDETRSTGAVPRRNGRTFRWQFETVFDNPGVPIVTIATWNEWLVHHNQYLGRDCFYDQFDMEFSKDMEPAANEMGHYYTNLLASCIRVYRRYGSCEAIEAADELCCRDLESGDELPQLGLGSMP